VKLVDCPKQGNQPWADTEDELVEFDVKYLLDCLGKLRGTSYHVVRRPDVEERHLPQPDYVAQESETGALLAIEHARFFESQDARKAEARVVKRYGGLLKWLAMPSPKQLGKRLTEFFHEKLAKGQLADFGHCERILLARNRWSGVSIGHFLKAEPYFNLSQLIDCDHFYMIADKRLVEVF